MADTSYQTQIYRKQGGTELVVPSGCKLTFETGAQWLGNSTQAAAIADQTTAHTTNPNAPTLAELITVMDTINLMSGRARALKLIST